MLLSLLLVTSLSIIILLYLPREKNLRKIFFWAFIARVLLMLIDLMQIIPIPGSGADTENFHSTAVYNQNVPFGNWDVITNYSTFLTIVYSLTDCSRWFAQYLNVLMGMGMLLYLNKTLEVLSINNMIRLQIVKIAAFMPNVIIFSAILLREAWVEMFIMMSLYYFVHWYVRKGQGLHIVLSLACVMAASWMHAGSIAVAVGYLVCILVYDRYTSKIKISKYSYVALFMVAAFVLIVMVNADTLLSKLGSLEDKSVDEFVSDKYSNNEEAGSAYLQWVSFSSPVEVILFSPLKMFYFLYSPIPFDWRGLMDIIAFVFDSVVYIFLSYKIIRSKVQIKKYRYLLLFIGISFLTATLVFSLGTIASGTAIRHRAKILTLLLVCYGLAMSNSCKKYTHYI